METDLIYLWRQVWHTRLNSDKSLQTKVPATFFNKMNT